MVDPGQLEISVSRSKIKWGAYLQDLMKPRFGGGFDSYSGRGPSVVAENCKGEKRVLAVTKTVKEATEKAEIIEREFEMLAPTTWCERYDVPPSFVSGSG
jgi:hypothetical protein